MECQFNMIDILKYAEGDLPPQRKKEFQEHLKDCSKCQVRLKEVKHTKKILIQNYGNIPRPNCPSKDIVYQYYGELLSDEDVRKYEKHLKDCVYCQVEQSYFTYELPDAVKKWHPSKKKFKEFIQSSSRKKEKEEMKKLILSEPKALVQFLTEKFILQSTPGQLKGFKEEFEENYLRADHFARNRIPPRQEEIPLETAAFADSAEVKSLYYEIVVVAYRLAQALRMPRNELTKEMKHLVKSHYQKEMVNFMADRLKEL